MLKLKLSRLISAFVFFLLAGTLSSLFALPSYAASCRDFQLSYTTSIPSNTCSASAYGTHYVEVTSGNALFSTGESYELGSVWLEHNVQANALNARTVKFTFSTNDHPEMFGGGYLGFMVYGPYLPSGGCILNPNILTQPRQYQASIVTMQERIVEGPATRPCYGCNESGTKIFVDITGIKECGIPFANRSVHIRIKKSGTTAINIVKTTNNNGDIERINFTPSEPGVYELSLKKDSVSSPFLKKRILVVVDCEGRCEEAPPASTETSTRKYKICEQIDREKNAAQYEKCVTCLGAEDGTDGIWTAVGCIPREPEKVVMVIVRLGLGIGGGYALLSILGASFILTVSQGDPKQIDNAKQQLTAALGGLIFIIFSVFILHYIGYTILKIPGFGEP